MYFPEGAMAAPEGENTMANEQAPEHEVVNKGPESFGLSNKFLLIFLVLVALAVGEIYTMHKTSSMRAGLEAQQTQASNQLRAELFDQLASRLKAIEGTNAQQIDALKGELDQATKRMGAAGGELKHARTMVAQLEKEQRKEAQQFQAELAQKADQQQMGALNKDVSAQRSDLDNTKKALESVRSDLGMARSEMGTLIARNHDEIEQLRKLGERDYLEFTASRRTLTRVGGVGLTLTKTNVKRHRFSLELLTDDLKVEKKDRTINEPIFFYVSGSKRPYELVINVVSADQVKGYLSTPKGATEVAARSEGTH
jgi:multidrug efflux pump subunit AcrA (membrane-fusion protein)